MNCPLLVVLLFACLWSVTKLVRRLLSPSGYLGIFFTRSRLATLYTVKTNKMRVADSRDNSLSRGATTMQGNMHSETPAPATTFPFHLKCSQTALSIRVQHIKNSSASTPSIFLLPDKNKLERTSLIVCRCLPQICISSSRYRTSIHYNYYSRALLPSGLFQRVPASTRPTTLPTRLWGVLHTSSERESCSSV